MTAMGQIERPSPAVPTDRISPIAGSRPLAQATKRSCTKQPAPVYSSVLASGVPIRRTRKAEFRWRCGCDSRPTFTRRWKAGIRRIWPYEYRSISTTALQQFDRASCLRELPQIRWTAVLSFARIFWRRSRCWSVMVRVSNRYARFAWALLVRPFARETSLKNGSSDFPQA